MNTKCQVIFWYNYIFTPIFVAPMITIQIVQINHLQFRCESEVNNLYYRN